MAGHKIAPPEARKAARAVEDLLSPPTGWRDKIRARLARGIADVAAKGRPTEQQIDDLLTDFPTLGRVQVGSQGGPHHDQLLIGTKARRRPKLGMRGYSNVVPRTSKAGAYRYIPRKPRALRPKDADD
ncbi:hypothetical protein ABZ705_27310 [Streptomyces sp. NPDC006984]|uniref:hypothetical protein n=1 Tax=Streptomyces sp. NPDC006984 TaxID=3155463 RepID=UPI0034015115